jgi:hypothetical protein
MACWASSQPLENAGLEGGPPPARPSCCAAILLWEEVGGRRFTGITAGSTVACDARNTPDTPPPPTQVWDLPQNGVLSAVLLLTITAGAMVSSAFFERRMWCRYLCPIGGPRPSSRGALLRASPATSCRSHITLCLSRLWA